MKFRLYSSQSDWTSRNSSLESHLGIPNGNGTFRYASVWQVENPENADYEKYIIPVCTEGTWKCDDQFNPSDLVDYDPTWELPTPR
jgi:hypothetical protein